MAFLYNYTLRRVQNLAKYIRVCVRGTTYVFIFIKYERFLRRNCLQKSNERTNTKNITYTHTHVRI